MIFPQNNIINVKIGKDFKIDEEVCKANYEFWIDKFHVSENKKDDLTNVLHNTNRILPAHTFAYYKDGKCILKSIFGYNEKSRTFDSNCKGVVAKKFRTPDVPIFGHMRTSSKLSHDIFNFAYLGVHNPYHRSDDDHPIRPFGLYLKKEVERFGYCHGSPCDIAEENDLVDRQLLKRYYLLCQDLRTLKAIEIVSSNAIIDFWYYFGNPENWINDDNYSDNLYKRTGEFRYYNSIAPSDIEAILWPLYKDNVYDDSDDSQEQFELYYAFKEVFSELGIKQITYDHDNGYQQDWEITLVEASYFCTKYYLKYNQFPSDANIAINEFKNNKNEE